MRGEKECVAISCATACACARRLTSTCVAGKRRGCVHTLRTPLATGLATGLYAVCSALLFRLLLARKTCSQGLHTFCRIGTIALHCGRTLLGGIVSAIGTVADSGHPLRTSTLHHFRLPLWTSIVVHSETMLFSPETKRFSPKTLLAKKLHR